MRPIAKFVFKLIYNGDVFHAFRKWDKVFKYGTGNICERQPLKILLGPLLNTLSQTIASLSIFKIESIKALEINFRKSR